MTICTMLVLTYKIRLNIPLLRLARSTFFILCSSGLMLVPQKKCLIYLLKPLLIFRFLLAYLRIYLIYCIFLIYIIQFEYFIFNQNTYNYFIFFTNKSIQIAFTSDRLIYPSRTINALFISNLQFFQRV